MRMLAPSSVRSAPSGARSNAQAGAEANTPTDPETKELTEAAMNALADALLELLVEFARQLRQLGLDVSLVELTDALRAVRDADFLDRARLRRLLMITLVKRAADIPTFVAAFELLFPAAGPQQADSRRAGPLPGPASGPPGQAADADLLSRFVAALRGDKSAGLQDLATEAVTAFSGLGADGAPGAAGSGRSACSVHGWAVRDR